MQKNSLSVLFILLAALVQAQIPILNSNPTYTAKVIYLDFDGQVVSGTSWDNGGTINAQASNASSASIRQIWKRVSEDYRPFDVNITTDSAAFNAADANTRMRVIFTPDYQWYSNNAGGVAYVGSFAWGGTPGTPCWIFESQLSNNPKYMAEAASHEAGHTLNLRHQSRYNSSCVKLDEYHPGLGGSSIISWAPIMGVGYDRNVTIWHNGPNTNGCTSYQYDHGSAGITASGYLNFLQDDVGQTLGTAKFLNLSTALTVDSGIITTPADIDAYKFTICSQRYVSVNAKPWALDTVNYDGANLDIRLNIYDAADNLLAIDTTLTKLTGFRGLNLSPGTYYFTIDGGRSPYASDYGSLGKYYLSIKATNPPAISATIAPTPTVCSGQSVTLNATANGPVTAWHWTVTGNTSFTSSAQSPTQLFAGGIHTVTLIAESSSYTGCPVTGTIDVTPIPTLSIAGGTVICPPQNLVITASGAQSYTWMPGNTSSATRVLNSSTPLSYTIFSANGSCTSTTNYSASINPTFAITLKASKTVICKGDTVTLKASGANSYTANPGGPMTGSNIVLMPSSSNNYYVTGQVGVCSQIAMVPLAVVPAFTLDVTASTDVACDGDTIAVTATGAVSYTLNPGNIVASSSTFVATPGTIYSVTATSHSACAAQQKTTTVQVELCDVSVPEHNKRTVAIYPNPAGQWLVVANAQGATIQITDISGAAIAILPGVSEQVISCSDWARGMYFITVTYATGIKETKKVILQ
jgi:hypothetical protein